MGVAAAGMAMAMISPALAQGERGGSDRNRDDGYSSSSDRGGSDRQSEPNSSGSGRYDNDRYDDRYNGDRYNNRRTRTLSFPTRYRATILLTETVTRDRRGADTVCFADVRGPEARRISRKEVSRVARNNCSRYARIVIR